MENDRIIWGCINDNGTTDSPAQAPGFKSEKFQTGLYRVRYAQSFLVPPSVVLTQNYPNWNETVPLSTGNTLDNAVLVASDENGFVVKTGDRNGAASDRNFTFMAIGRTS